jgi:hypothetical protein
MHIALAGLADELVEGKKAAIAALTGFVAPLLTFIGPPGIARLITHQLVQHVTAVPAAEVDAVITALWAYGVLLCVLGDRDLAACTCLRRLAASEVEDRIRSVVGHGLDSLRADVVPRS